MDSIPNGGSIADPALPAPEPASADQSEDLSESHDSPVEVTNEIQEERPVSEQKEPQEKEKVLTPYGLPCVRELLRFLVSIISSEDGYV